MNVQAVKNLGVYYGFQDETPTVDQILQKTYAAFEEYPDVTEAIIRYMSGQQLSFSSSVAEFLTAGYGDLDGYGHFEFPLPTDFVNEVLCRPRNKA